MRSRTRHLIIIAHADDDSVTLYVAIASSFLEKLWRDRGERLRESESFYCFTCRRVSNENSPGRDQRKIFFLLEIRYRELKLGSSNERTLVALVAFTTRNKWKKFLCCLYITRTPSLPSVFEKTFTSSLRSLLSRWYVCIFNNEEAVVSKFSFRCSKYDPLYEWNII